MTFLARLQGELRQLELDPPPGIATWPKDEMNITELEASEKKTRHDVFNELTFLMIAIRGTEDTPYAGGLFRLRISIPQRFELLNICILNDLIQMTFWSSYPFEPPSARFITPIYHPNIDSGGRICLNTLHMPPKVITAFFFFFLLLFQVRRQSVLMRVLSQGVWTPALNIAALLKTIQLLMNAPNADDGLVIDIVSRIGGTLNDHHSLISSSLSD